MTSRRPGGLTARDASAEGLAGHDAFDTAMFDSCQVPASSAVTLPVVPPRGAADRNAPQVALGSGAQHIGGERTMASLPNATAERPFPGELSVGRASGGPQAHPDARLSIQRERERERHSTFAPGDKANAGPKSGANSLYLSPSRDGVATRDRAAASAKHAMHACGGMLWGRVG